MLYTDPIYTHFIWIVIFHNANYLKKLKLVQVSELSSFFFCFRRKHVGKMAFEYQLYYQLCGLSTD